MGNLATTYLRQARSFLRAGDPQRAIELLEKARVLAGSDYGVKKQVLEEMAEALSAAGRHDQASRCRQRLEAMFPPNAGQQSNDAGAITLPLARTRRWPLILGVLAVILVLLGGAVAVTVVAMQSRVRPEASSAPAVTPAQPLPPVGSASIGPTGAMPPSHVPAASGPTTTAAQVEKQDLLKETVGLVVIMLRYEGTASGQQVRISTIS